MDQIINHFAYAVLLFALGHFFGSRRARQSEPLVVSQSIPDAIWKKNKQKKKPKFISEAEQWKREQNQPPNDQTD